MVASVLVSVISMISFPKQCLVSAANGYDDYYKQAATDDAGASSSTDDASANQYEAAATNDYTAVADDTYSSSGGSSGSNAYEYEQSQYQNTDDDTFHWNSNKGLDGVSVMPLSCIN